MDELLNYWLLNYSILIPSQSVPATLRGANYSTSLRGARTNTKAKNNFLRRAVSIKHSVAIPSLTTETIFVMRFAPPGKKNPKLLNLGFYYLKRNLIPKTPHSSPSSLLPVSLFPIDKYP
jgi:hypothetical protein